MRRLIVLLAFSVGLGALGVMACGGGNDKAPLTPDNVEPPPTDLSEAGVPSSSSSAAPAPVPSK